MLSHPNKASPAPFPAGSARMPANLLVLLEEQMMLSVPAAAQSVLASQVPGSSKAFWWKVCNLRSSDASYTGAKTAVSLLRLPLSHVGSCPALWGLDSRIQSPTLPLSIRSSEFAPDSAFLRSRDPPLRFCRLWATPLAGLPSALTTLCPALGTPPGFSFTPDPSPPAHTVPG